VVLGEGDKQPVRQSESVDRKSHIRNLHLPFLWREPRRKCGERSITTIGTPGRSVTADGDGYNRSSGPGRRARTGVSHQARCPVRQGMAPAAKIYGSSNAKVCATIIIGTLMDSLRTYASAWALLAEIGLVFVGEVYASTPYWVERMRSLSM